MNLYTKKKHSQRENKLMANKGEGKGGINYEYVINKHELLYTKQINKSLPYSTENYNLSSCNNL